LGVNEFGALEKVFEHGLDQKDLVKKRCSKGISTIMHFKNHKCAKHFHVLKKASKCAEHCHVLQKASVSFKLLITYHNPFANTTHSVTIGYESNNAP
jgi:hypothetical protein